jgi:mRNA interferase HigB
VYDDSRGAAGAICDSPLHFFPKKEAEDARWQSPADIKARYRSADFLPGNRVVFNIKGNHYRLVVKIHYNTGVVYIRFVGTHEEYILTA